MTENNTLSNLKNILLINSVDIRCAIFNNSEIIIIHLRLASSRGFASGPFAHFIGLMRSSPQTPPTLDLSRISFPTDTLTVKAVREAESTRDGFDDRRELFLTNLESIIVTERDLARKAFDATIKGQRVKQDINTSQDRREIIDCLAADYKRYGLTTGPRQTVELVRNIETQAIDQARAFLGMSR